MEKIQFKFSHTAFLEQVVSGCVSGHFSEWPQLKPAVKEVLVLLSESQERVRELEEQLRLCNIDFANECADNAALRKEVEGLRDKFPKSVAVKLYEWMRSLKANNGDFLPADVCCDVVGMHRFINGIEAVIIQAIGRKP